MSSPSFALIINDLYHDLCSSSGSESKQLKQLGDVMFVLTRCWEESSPESCPPHSDAMDNSLRSGDICGYIKSTLEWLTTIEQTNTSKFFYSLTRNNVESNMSFLRKAGISDLDMAGLVQKSKEDDFKGLIDIARTMSQTLTNYLKHANQNTVTNSWSLLSLMAAVKSSRVDRRRRQKPVIHESEERSPILTGSMYLL